MRNFEASTGNIYWGSTFFEDKCVILLQFLNFFNISNIAQHVDWMGLGNSKIIVTGSPLKSGLKKDVVSKPLMLEGWKKKYIHKVSYY